MNTTFAATAISSTALPEVCLTTARVAGTGEVALLDVNAAALSVPAGSSLAIWPVYSTNGGTTWSGINSWYSIQESTAANSYLNTTHFGRLALTAGASYMFAIQMTDYTGAGYTTSGRCVLKLVVAKQ